MTTRPSAFIIGSGPGVGAAVARTFGGEGYALALLARNGARVTTAAEDLRAEGFKARGFAADAGEETALLAALDAATAGVGAPEILVYNAAAWRPGPVLDLTPEGLIEDFRVCTAGALTAARYAAGAMRSAGRGSILFTGGGLALYPSPDLPSLSIGKAAIRALALMLAAELAPSGIRVGTVTIAGAVAPGTSLSPERVAEAFLALHHSAPDPATAEIVLSP
jgi:NAD(P)-dependent dehydrogenase (short-subunit alcohol dehydrogenase family)